MALPSQGGFSSHRRGNMYRRRKRRFGFSWLIMIATAVGLTWFLWPDGDDPKGEAGDTTIVDASDRELLATPPRIEEEIISEEVTVAIDPVLPTPEPSVELPQEEPIEEVVEKPTLLVENPANTTVNPIPLAATTSTNLEAGLALLEKDQVIAARKQLSSSLRNGLLTPSEAAQARGMLRDLADRLIFSPEIVANDPYSIDYTVRGGDTLSGIVQKMGLQVNWRFIQRINGIKRASSIRPGQNLKLITGPFHAVINKSAYRIDLYLGDDDEQVFVRSYRVGLGEFNSTPVGLFKVRDNSKLINPTWVNPRTREFFAADNPENPIGERWIGLEGIEEQTLDLSGLGIHGTIAPETIGTNSSMGCIRMLSDDVAEVYEMLTEGVSTVKIR